MKIYTKTGDSGKTSLLGGTRVSKAHIRIQAYGTIDELNSYIGLLADQEINREQIPFLRSIQNKLFTIGSLLAADPLKNTMALPELREQDINDLEECMDLMDQNLAPLKSFLLPGGHQSVSFCHIARCVCRRAERLVIELGETVEIEGILVKYLNRLSDFLFVFARDMSRKLGSPEIPWKSKL